MEMKEGASRGSCVSVEIQHGAVYKVRSFRELLLILFLESLVSSPDKVLVHGCPMTGIGKQVCVTVCLCYNVTAFIRRTWET